VTGPARDDKTPSLYEWAGGQAAIRRLMDCFYDRVEEDEQPPNVPAPDEAIDFDEHVRTFFRKRDRQSMLFAFDLWAYDDVRQNAQAIFGRLRSGTMPCDGAWPSERIDAFERWTTTGMTP
jgi:hypothetical protein